MKKPKLRYLIAGGATAAMAIAALVYIPLSEADVAGSPDAAFTSWNNQFLVQNSNGDAYYTKTPKSKGTNPQQWFTAALDIQIAQDVYQRTHSPADQNLVSRLMAYFIKNNGKNWQPNSWNDDMAWMEETALRGYQDTGNESYLTIAKDNWDKTYARGWTAPAGGGIWEDNNNFGRGKCALSNNPAITTGVMLYQITGDSGYLTKAKGIYDWVRKTLVTTSTGQVHGCVFLSKGDSGTVSGDNSDNVYDAGSWIQAANLLYRVTGDVKYYNDAKLTADHIKNNVPIIHQNQGAGSSYQYRYFRGLSEFCTDNNLCGDYATYMQNNANSAWKYRDSNGLMWNDWTKTTNDPNADAFEMNSAVGLWQQLPYTGASKFTGQYQIKNSASGQYLTVLGGSTANDAAVVQTTQVGDPSTWWTLTLTSNGEYELKNIRSGQLVNVSGGSGKQGAAVAQRPDQNTTRLAGDQWLPIRNADGTYSFYNRSSQLALANPGGSTTAGTRYVQWGPDNSANEKFTLVAKSGSGSGSGSGGATSQPSSGATSAPTSGATTQPTTSGTIASGLAGKCLSAGSGNTVSGTPAQLRSCDNSAAQKWTAQSDGTLRNAGKCLDANALGVANGTKVQLWDCNGGTNQVWQSYNGGYRNPKSGRCLDDPAFAKTDGTPLQLFDCNSGANQRWALAS
jgi:predicted alpha-1,6-mannanase (GH76 family)